MEQTRVAEPRPPSDLDEYIGDMLGQLSTLAAKRGRSQLAERIRVLAEEAQQPRDA